nr:unnamed protein product [Callosobruchus chinensis]
MHREQFRNKSLHELRSNIPDKREGSSIMYEVDVNEVLHEMEEDMAEDAQDEQVSQLEEEESSDSDGPPLLLCRICQQPCPDEVDLCMECWLNIDDNFHLNEPLPYQCMLTIVNNKDTKT